MNNTFIKKRFCFQTWFMTLNLFKIKIFLSIIHYRYYLDRILFGLVIFNIIFNIVNFCSSIVDHMSVFHFCNEDSFLHMSANNSGSNLSGISGSGTPNSGGDNPGGLPGGSSNPESFGGYHTNRQIIIHEDGSWSNTIRSIVIYGTGAIRLHLLRNGPASQRFIVLGGVLIADGAGRLIQNVINDPNYVLAHVTN